MDASKALALINKTLELAADARKLGHDASPFALALWNNLVNKKVVNQVDLDLLDSQLKAISNRLQAPLLPEDDQDV